LPAAGFEPLLRQEQTSTPPTAVEHGEKRAPVGALLLSAKDQGSARSSSRSSKLCLRTALTNHFTTTWLRLAPQNRHCFKMKRLWKHVDHMQFRQVIAAPGE
jgi:hypothetical protein